jgi:hypothetical protein
MRNAESATSRDTPGWHYTVGLLLRHPNSNLASSLACNLVRSSLICTLRDSQAQASLPRHPGSRSLTQHPTHRRRFRLRQALSSHRIPSCIRSPSKAPLHINPTKVGAPRLSHRRPAKPPRTSTSSIHKAHPHHTSPRMLQPALRPLAMHLLPNPVTLPVRRRANTAILETHSLLLRLGPLRPKAVRIANTTPTRMRSRTRNITTLPITHTSRIRVNSRLRMILNTSHIRMITMA